MRQRWPVLLIAFVLLPSTIAGTTGRGAQALLGQSASQSLTRPIAMTTPGAQIPLESWEARARVITIDFAALPDRATAGGPPPAAAQLGIDLFDGRSIKAVFERFDPNTSGVTWVGSVPGIPMSRVTLVYGGGTMAASIVLPDASYSIRPVPLSLDPLNPGPTAAVPLHILAELDQRGLRPEAEPLEIPLPQSALDAAADAVMADTADIIELLIVYTAAAEAWAGGPSGMLNWINLGVSDTNSAYEASGVFQRVQLLDAERVPYTEVGSFSTNLSNLRNGFSGLIGVAGLRDTYGADLVSMIVRPAAPDACGIAFLMTSVSTAFAPSGYSVVDAPCVSPGGTLAHELGHNMGLRHDWFMDSGLTPFTYAHGYVNAAARFRTIMSYPNGCTALGISCTRLLAFSNPERFYLGVAMGVPGGTNVSCGTGNAGNMTCDADESRALNETAFAVANFRQAMTLRPPVIVGHPASQSVVRGQPVALTVAASGGGPFSYQWFRGPSPSTTNPIAGATGSTYAFVPGSDGIWSERWFYWARVSNNIGAANSLAATLTLLPGGPSDANRGRNEPSAGAGPPVRLGVAPKTVALPGGVARGESHTVFDAAPTTGAVHRAVCSTRLSVLLAVARFAERSGNDDLAALVWVLRAKAGLALDPRACDGDDE